MKAQNFTITGMEATKFNDSFRARLVALRNSMELSQRDFAALLGLKEARYGKYETRGGFPMHLIPRLCEITGHDPWYILTGQVPAAKPKPIGPALGGAGHSRPFLKLPAK